MNLMEGVGAGEGAKNEQPTTVQWAQSWHQDVSPELRQHLVRKLLVINVVVS